jgi:DNA-binding transcriptional regulator YiaG
MKDTTKRPFDVYAPGTKDCPPKFLETIDVEVETRTGQEFLTHESRRRIEEIRARHMGLMTGEAIKVLRKRLKLTQKELTERINCGEKMVSHWENGHGLATGAHNLLLRLLDEGHIGLNQLAAVSGPRTEMAPEHFFLTRQSNVVHYNFRNVRAPQARKFPMDDLALASSS